MFKNNRKLLHERFIKVKLEERRSTFSETSAIFEKCGQAHQTDSQDPNDSFHLIPDNLSQNIVRRSSLHSPRITESSASLVTRVWSIIQLLAVWNSILQKDDTEESEDAKRRNYWDSNWFFVPLALEVAVGVSELHPWLSLEAQKHNLHRFFKVGESARQGERNFQVADLNYYFAQDSKPEDKELAFYS